MRRPPLAQISAQKKAIVRRPAWSALRVGGPTLVFGDKSAADCVGRHYSVSCTVLLPQLFKQYFSQT